MDIKWLGESENFVPKIGRPNKGEIIRNLPAELGEKFERSGLAQRLPINRKITDAAIKFDDRLGG